jgi:hypothetical protein
VISVCNQRPASRRSGRLDLATKPKRTISTA